MNKVKQAYENLLLVSLPYVIFGVVRVALGYLVNPDELDPTLRFLSVTALPVFITSLIMVPVLVWLVRRERHRDKTDTF